MVSRQVGRIGRKAPSIKPMKQQRQQHKNLLWQFIQLNIPMLRDVKGYMILNIPLLSPRSELCMESENSFADLGESRGMLRIM